MMKKILFIIFSIYFLGKSVDAAHFMLSGYTDIGKSATADDYLEEDYHDDYYYENYHVKFYHQISNKVNYDLRTFLYQKNYNQRNELDSYSHIYKSRITYKRSKRINFSLSLKYREKRFDLSDITDFNQISFKPQLTYKKYNDYAVIFITGIDNFNYLNKNSKDQLKIFSQLQTKKYFNKNSWVIDGTYRIENLNKRRINRKKIKHNLLGGLSHKLAWDWINKISGKIYWGYMDSKNDDEKDIDYDYRYLNYRFKTEHYINNKINTNIQYGYFNKDYLSVALDHHAFYLENNWRYQLLNEGDNKIWINLNVIFKHIRYKQDALRNYHSESLKIKINTKAAREWKLSLAVQSYLYQYKADNDKSSTYTIFSAEKSLWEDIGKIFVDLKYRFVSYQKKSDRTDMGGKIGFQYGF